MTEKFTIRKARETDLDEMMQIYADARGFMKQTGNPTQWGDSYPSRERILQDIREEVSYVGVTREQGSEKIAIVFVYRIWEDPTYAVIEKGSWPNDRPYGVMHRVAGNGTVKGAASLCMQWCLAQCGNLRCDTHKNNKIMQHVLEKNGFKPCGIIYTDDGSERIAYQAERSTTDRNNL